MRELGSEAAVCAMPEDRISTADVALWTLTCVMALALLLLAPQLSANSTGRVVTVVVSVAVFACSIHPTLHSPWLRNDISRRIVLCFVATGIVAFGWVLWPYSLNVSRAVSGSQAQSPLCILVRLIGILLGIGADARSFSKVDPH